jgi:hypothetical protein
MSFWRHLLSTASTRIIVGAFRKGWDPKVLTWPEER